MPVPASINDLSTTVASNSPAGSETPTDGDNYLRSFASFIALLRDGGAITGKLTGVPLGSAALPSYSFTGDVDTGMWSPAANTLALSVGGTERLRLTSDGRLYGTALHNNAGAVTGATNQYLASGTYTPTITALANVAASTPRAAQWLRVGNVVTVSAQFDVTPTAVGTYTQFAVSLPIASAISNSWEIAGNAIVYNGGDTSQPLTTWVTGDPTNDRVLVEYASAGTVSRSVSLTFTYVVL